MNKNLITNYLLLGVFALLISGCADSNDSMHLSGEIHKFANTEECVRNILFENRTEWETPELDCDRGICKIVHRSCKSSESDNIEKAIDKKIDELKKERDTSQSEIVRMEELKANYFQLNAF